jgi:hypothetical protein
VSTPRHEYDLETFRRLNLRHGLRIAVLHKVEHVVADVNTLACRLSIAARRVSLLTYDLELAVKSVTGPLIADVDKRRRGRR